MAVQRGFVREDGGVRAGWAVWLVPFLIPPLCAVTTVAG